MCIRDSRSKYWDNAARKKLAISLLNDDKLDSLIEKNMINFRDLPKFFSNVSKHKNFYCKVVNYGVKINV